MRKMFAQATIVYGALTIILLFSLGVHLTNTAAMVAAVVSAAMAYMSSMFSTAMTDDSDMGTPLGVLLNLVFMLASIVAACVSFLFSVWS